MGMPRKYHTAEERHRAHLDAMARHRRRRGMRPRVAVLSAPPTSPHWTHVERQWVKDDGLPPPLSRAMVAHRSDYGPTPTASLAGLASENLSWILRGLYQEQWDAVLEHRQYGREFIGRRARKLLVRHGGL
jgi:hypothetical protein